MRKDFKIYLVIGLLTLNLICSLSSMSSANASEGLQSTGKIVATNPETNLEEIIFDANDQVKLKDSINANSSDINYLKEFTEEQSEINNSLREKDIGLEDNVTDLTNSLGGIEFSLDADGKGQYRAVGESEWKPFLSRIDSGKLITLSTTVTLYNSIQADIFSVTSDDLQSYDFIYMTFLSAYAGDVLTNLNWEGVSIDEVIKNETHGGIQHYIARVTFDGNTASLKADYSYNRNRQCNVYVLIL